MMVIMKTGMPVLRSVLPPAAAMELFATTERLMKQVTRNAMTGIETTRTVARMAAQSTLWGWYSEFLEGCDDGNDNPKIRSIALQPVAAMAVQDGESCDDGTVNTDASSNLTAFCGDGLHRQDRSEGEDGYEAHDDGNLSNSDACTSNCRVAVCGDHHLFQVRGLRRWKPHRWRWLRARLHLVTELFAVRLRRWLFVCSATAENGEASTAEACRPTCSAARRGSKD